MQNGYLGLLNIPVFKYSKKALEAEQVALIADYDYFVAFLMRSFVAKKKNVTILQMCKAMFSNIPESRLSEFS